MITIFLYKKKIGKVPFFPDEAQDEAKKREQKIKKNGISHADG